MLLQQEQTVDARNLALSQVGSLTWKHLANMSEKVVEYAAPCLFT